MNLLTIAIIFSIILAFVFTFLNGMNDAANSISTIIATKVMTPIQAIIWASFWEFAAFFLIRLVLHQQFAVGNTMANFADQNVIDPYLILSRWGGHLGGRLHQKRYAHLHLARPYRGHHRGGMVRQRERRTAHAANHYHIGFHCFITTYRSVFGFLP